ncbi:hypothetical protein HGRIS_008273 [Hohenbuehelia grisea]|uniref:Bromo domain-containing protein n=1 Tax=Hohenbuehelia grisea TaxID=104357 RepID=A0ABR3J7M7_9AGAR
MSKRLSDASANADDLEHRAKRRKAGISSSSEQDPSKSDPVVGGDEAEEGEPGGSPAQVKEQGLQLWQMIREATNKEGRILSNDFLRLPSKRQYPDYYQIITRPIALDDIKKKIEGGKYVSLEGVRQDLDLCFRNAKQYNMPDSVIWVDAKELQKLVKKNFEKMTNPGDDGEKKSKTPSMGRLLKSRLQKLVDKTDDSGRILATEFLELPSRKEWPIYYKDIKRPQCIENIFKRLKRKEYHTSADFAKDVELVFANAMQFNEANTQIWEDARTLRDHFARLMSDLPPPHALPEYQKQTNTKIKLKVPATNASSSTAQQSPPQASSSSSILLRVPATNATAKTTAQATKPQPSQPAQTPAKSSPTTVQASTSTKVAVPTVQAPKPIAATPVRPVQPAQIQPATPVPRVSTPHLPIPNAHSTPQAAQSSANSPAPIIPSRYQLRYVFLRAEPSNRKLHLDHRDGVKTFATRLGAGERSLRVTGISVVSNEEEESSDEEQADEDEGGDDAMEVDAPTKNGRKPAKGRGRKRQGKPTKPAVRSDGTAKKQKPSSKCELQVKLNGEVVQRSSDNAEDWLLELNAGMNGVEVGEKGGLVWRLLVERGADS